MINNQVLLWLSLTASLSIAPPCQKHALSPFWPGINSLLLLSILFCLLPLSPLLRFPPGLVSFRLAAPPPPGADQSRPQPTLSSYHRALIRRFAVDPTIYLTVYSNADVHSALVDLMAPRSRDGAPIGILPSASHFSIIPLDHHLPCFSTSNIAAGSPFADISLPFDDRDGSTLGDLVSADMMLRQDPW